MDSAEVHGTYLVNKTFSIYLQVIILDVRVPSVPVARLCNHRAAINGITWAPHSSCHICSAGIPLIHTFNPPAITHFTLKVMTNKH